MTNSDLYRVREGINKCSDVVNAASINFAFTLAKIEEDVAKEIKVLDKVRKDNTEYAAYAKAVEELDAEYRVTNESGVPLFFNNAPLIKDPKAYNISIAELKTKYAQAISKNEEFITLLESNCTATITSLPKSYIPNQLSVEQVRLLFPVIVDIPVETPAKSTKPEMHKAE